LTQESLSDIIHPVQYRRHLLIKGVGCRLHEREISMSQEGSISGPVVASPKTRILRDVRPPRMYRVLLHNDDYTTMDFVVEVLISVFHKAAAEATRVMLDVHRQGHGVCGVYTLDVARTKAGEVRRRARKQQFPLRCTCEPV